MDSKLKKIIASVGGLVAVGAGFCAYALGWWELPKETEANAAEIKAVDKKVEDTKTNLDKLVLVQTAQAESQKTVNDLLITTLKDRRDNG